MSQENVEIVKRMVDVWNRGDLAGWAEGLHEEIKWVPLAENTQTETICGADATLAFVKDWLEPWEEYRIEVLRILDAGDWFVMCTRQSARHSTGAEISMDMHAAGTLREGKLVEMKWFMEEADAREAAGLTD
jgi:ketosteroid isomerase-like protein